MFHSKGDSKTLCKKKKNNPKIKTMSEPSKEIISSGKETSQKRKFKDVDEIVKKKDVKKPPMPTYGKYNILKMLKENHCLIADEEQLSNAFPRNKRYNLDDIKSNRH